MPNPYPQRDLHIAATEVIRALTEPGANPEYHAKQRARLHLNWPVLDQRLRDLRVAAAFSTAGFTEYGIHIKFPDRQFMHPIQAHGRWEVWTADRELVDQRLARIQNDPHLNDANIRIIARHISPTWEVKD